MGQKLFVPLTDDLMYDTPEMITSGLMPYRVDMPCYHWEVSLDGGQEATPEGSEAGYDHGHRSGSNVLPFPQELAA